MSNSCGGGSVSAVGGVVAMVIMCREWVVVVV